jgi:hypothetical protein
MAVVARRRITHHGTCRSFVRLTNDLFAGFGGERRGEDGLTVASPTTPSERAINALRRIAPATRALARLCRMAATVGGIATLALLGASGPRLVPLWPWGTVTAVLLLVVLAAPAAWLLHAGATLDDLSRLPATVTTRPEVTIATRAERARLRHGGWRQVVRAIRTTVGEYGDLVGPWRAAVEVSTPWFWTWTGAAAVAAAVELLLVPFAALAALLT